ncbi:hypothetical protein D3C86_1663380 [compost metagenome]
MRPGAIVVQAQGARHRVGTQQFRLAAAQSLALGVGWQLLGVADTYRNLAGGQQVGHQQVVGPAYHQHHPGRLGAQAPEQGGQQGELDVIREADAKYRGAGCRIEVGGAADRGGDRIQRR